MNEFNAKSLFKKTVIYLLTVNYIVLKIFYDTPSVNMAINLGRN
jgi:hypothetical protein